MDRTQVCGTCDVGSIPTESTIKRKIFNHMNNKGFANIVIIVLIVILVGTISYFVFVKKSNEATPVNINNQFGQETISIPVNETASWKVFKSGMEGFSIKYPNDWTVENSSNGNCGHNKLDDSDCRDRYDFVSPDGVRVRYVVHKDENDDRIGCGRQSLCWSDGVMDLEKLNIQNLGQIFLVKLDDKKIALHQPLSQETIPVVGENKHSNFGIDFSLPSKTGGRYGLFITTSFAGREPAQFQNISAEQFYNLKSVKQGVLILKSLSY